MNDKSVFNKFAYQLIMHHKTNIYKELKELKLNEVNELPNIILLSLYVTDYDTVNKEMFSDNDQERVKELLELDNLSFVKITKEDLTDLIKSCKEKRLPKELHDRVCFKIAEYDNSIYEEGSVHRVNLDNLKYVLDNIKYPENKRR